MPPFNTLLLRLVIVIIIGGLIGAERELKSKSAGFRTIMMICLGSFLFTTFSVYISPQTPDRIASNIVTGIGFLGAGVIFKGDNRVNGLTTAATIWVTAALGMGVATGQYTFVFVATCVVLGSLFLLTKIEQRIDKASQFKTYKITIAYHHTILQEYEALFVENKLKYKQVLQVKNGPDITVSWIAEGRENNHQQFIQSVCNDVLVQRFEVY